MRQRFSRANLRSQSKTVRILGGSKSFIQGDLTKTPKDWLYFKELLERLEAELFKAKNAPSLSKISVP